MGLDFTDDPVPVPLVQFVSGVVKRDHPGICDGISQGGTVGMGKIRVEPAMDDEERHADFTKPPDEPVAAGQHRMVHGGPGDARPIMLGKTPRPCLIEGGISSR